MRKTTAILLCITWLTLLQTASAAAEDVLPAANPPPGAAPEALLAEADLATTTEASEPLWEIRLAGFGRYGEAYPAAKESQVNIVPLPFPIYRGKFLRVGDETQKPVRTRIFRRDRIKLDLDFGLNFPVDSEDIDARTGMPDLDLLAEVGPELELQFSESLFGGEAYLALQARGAVSVDGLNPEWRGMVFSTELRHKRTLFSPKTQLMTRFTPEFASADYMDFFYGVASEFGTASRPTYKARSGYLGSKLAFSLKHAVNDEFEIRSGVRFGFYQGAKNEDSPLFTRDTTSSVFVAFLWKFWESERRESLGP